MNVVKYGALAGALMISCAAQQASALSVVDTVTVHIDDMTVADNDPYGYTSVDIYDYTPSLAYFDTRLGIATSVQLSTSLTGTLSASLNGANASASAAITSAVSFVGSDYTSATGFINLATAGDTMFDGPVTADYATFGDPNGYGAFHVGERFSAPFQTRIEVDYYGDPDPDGLVVSLKNVSATASIEYTYVKHAQAAFDTPDDYIVLDFGTVAKGSGSLTKSFNIGNIGDADTSALWFYGIASAGASTFHETTAFQDQIFAPGERGSITLGFDPDTVGDQYGKFYLSFLDDARGAGQRGSTLIVYTTAKVIGAAAAGVPEPASWALMLGGFGLLGTNMRRRRAAVRVTYA